MCMWLCVYVVVTYVLDASLTGILSNSASSRKRALASSNRRTFASDMPPATPPSLARVILYMCVCATVW